MVVGSVWLVGAAAGVLVSACDGDGDGQVAVVFGENDGLPDELDSNSQYRATFTIDWSGPVSDRDGEARVFASRRGDTTEDAPADGWPLVCESEYDDAVSRTRMVCAFVAPGPGEFALQLEVVDDDDNKLGEGLYTHLVIDTSTTEP
jgi:hypothetical protein